MSETPQHVYPKASVGEQSANVAPNPDFPQLEQDVLRYWDTNGTFQKSIDENPSGEHSSNEFVFFDGFGCTGRPRRFYWARRRTARLFFRRLPADDGSLPGFVRHYTSNAGTNATPETRMTRPIMPARDSTPHKSKNFKRWSAKRTSRRPIR